MATMRRDTLKRRVEQGKVTLVESYHFDDMMGSSRTTKEMPVALAPADWHDRKEGVCYIHPCNFEGNCGRAYTNPDGTVTLYVHSNCNYTFRVKE